MNILANKTIPLTCPKCGGDELRVLRKLAFARPCDLETPPEDERFRKENFTDEGWSQFALMSVATEASECRQCGQYFSPQHMGLLIKQRLQELNAPPTPEAENDGKAEIE